MAATDEIDGEDVAGVRWSHLTAEVVEYADEPTECTIYPGDAPAELLLTTWVSAREGSFVKLGEMR